MTKNHLTNESSPYLLQHKDNPVHWYPWGDEAFSAARQTGKPILLSIGYAACHWCHVMAHESFEDDVTAGVMNDLYINIKVDREEHPDVDKIYMDAIHALGEQGGWPLTMFLDHDGKPFWGGTYFPVESAYGRPGFKQVLTQISRIWHEDHSKVEANSAAITDALKQSTLATAKAELTDELLKQAATGLVQAIDQQHGGLRGAPKFPQTSIFDFMWRMGVRMNNQAIQQSILTTLTHICQGGIYDHLAGGFSRYSVDQFWLAPHFEKMLYDNAQLVTLLARVWNRTGNELFRMRIEETIDWVIRDMKVNNGAFAASYDADSEGEEGKFYVWSKPEIEGLLDNDAERFCSVYNVTQQGNWEGKTILNRLHQLELLDPETEFALANNRQTLLKERDKRIPPGWDDKVLADWNGLMIEALAEAGMILGRNDWIEAAEAALDDLLTLLWTGNELWHSWRGGKRRNKATLDDCANLIAGCLTLYQATGKTSHVTTAERLVAYANDQFSDTENGGYYFTASSTGNLIVRSRFAHDDATPNGNAVMLASLTRLSLITGKQTYQQQAKAVHDAFAANVLKSPAAHSRFLSAFDDMINITQAILISKPDDPQRIVMRDAVIKYADPSMVLIHVTPDHVFDKDHPAHGKSQIGGKATAYICKGQTCSLPVTDPDNVAKSLAKNPT